MTNSWSPVYRAVTTKKNTAQLGHMVSWSPPSRSTSWWTSWPWWTSETSETWANAVVWQLSIFDFEPKHQLVTTIFLILFRTTYRLYSFDARAPINEWTSPVVPSRCIGPCILAVKKLDISMTCCYETLRTQMTFKHIFYIGHPQKLEIARFFSQILTEKFILRIHGVILVSIV